MLIEGALTLLSRRTAFAKSRRLVTLKRTVFKKQIAELANISPDSLPYNEALLTYLHEVKKTGRPILLVTAAHKSVARAVADYVGIFDDVIASDGDVNLKGEAKARELVRRFGHKGFDYAGNDRADFAIWREADGIILVDASSAVAQ